MTVNAKVYGLFRSGTNLIKLLAETHLDARIAVNKGGHKHLTSPIDWRNGGYVEPKRKFLVCVKDPYAAMASLHKYAAAINFRHFQCAKPWKRFLDERFIVRIKHESSPPAVYFASPIDYWNAFHFHFMSFESGVLFIRYEDVLADPAAVVARIGGFLEARRTSDTPPALPGLTVAKMGETTRDDPLTDDPFDAEWYADKAYLQAFSAAQMAVMRDRLDAEVLSALGYALEPVSRAAASPAA